MTVIVRPAREDRDGGKGRVAELVGMVRRDENNEDGYKVMTGWRVGHAPDEATTRSGLLVPAGIKEGNDALPLVDVHTGQRFWAVPAGAWRFIWPPTGRPVIAVRESQIIAEEELSHVGDGGQYL
ncbi:hypothetical protein BH18ACT5_BH18ACT5_15200 [soil metagenome]